jgi:hypothetical protein
MKYQNVSVFNSIIETKIAGVTNDDERIIINKSPNNAIEEHLMTVEELSLAMRINCYWDETSVAKDYFCDLCNSKIIGRHLIDSKLCDSNTWALMCPTCHTLKGSGFGEGKGQLYTRTVDNKWLLTQGFTLYQLMSDLVGEREDDEWWYNFWSILHRTGLQ